MEYFLKKNSDGRKLPFGSICKFSNAISRSYFNTLKIYKY